LTGGSDPEHDGAVPSVLALAGLAIAVLAPVDEETWHQSVDPSRCESKAVVEYPRWSRWVHHRMVPGETIAEVAARYGLREIDLRQHNGISAKTETLKKGTRLKVKARRVPPPREHVEYTVVAGDSWLSIARIHGVDPKELKAYNWPWKGKLAAGSLLSVWIDPIARMWIGAAEEGEAIRRGGIGIGAPDDGHLVGGVAIPEGEGYEIRFPDSAYGTTHAVVELVRALARYRETTKRTSPLQLGSMSRPRGGPLGGHKSHQTGRDIDILLPRKPGVPSWYPLTPRRVDWMAVWDLALALDEVDASVMYLDYALQKEMYRTLKAAGIDQELIAKVLQYPRGYEARRGLVRHEPGHTQHLHVRFGCGPCEVECIELGAWAQ
jgi:murein endopeptidase